MITSTTKMVKMLEQIGFEYLNQSTRRNLLIPKISGVYCFITYDILTQESELIYIGKSKDFSSRLKPWHRIEGLAGLNCTWCYIKPCENFDDTEIDLIKKFAPKYNIQHNPKIRRIITYA